MERKLKNKLPDLGGSIYIKSDRITLYSMREQNEFFTLKCECISLKIYGKNLSYRPRFGRVSTK